MNINFEYYKIFYYVAKYHNFTKAAKVLENSQPNVTRAMNCLEQQMHSTLFVRTNRGVQLTPVSTQQQNQSYRSLLHLLPPAWNDYRFSVEFPDMQYEMTLIYQTNIYLTLSRWLRSIYFHVPCPNSPPVLPLPLITDA
jgi:hypothetical protein